MKSVRTRNFAGLYFPAFRLNTGTYSESLRIHFECGKMQIGKILNTDTFTRCVYQRNLLMRNLHLTCNLGAPHLAFSCSKSTIKTKKQSHQIPHIVVVFPLSKNHSVYSFRYCIVILGLVTRKVRPWVKLTLTTKKYYDNSNHNDDYFWNADYKLAISFSAQNVSPWGY